MGGNKVHADDTPVPVLAPGRGKTRTGRLWTYVRDDRAAASEQPAAVWFGYSPDRKGEHPQRHLKGFQVSTSGDLANWSTGAPDAVPAVGGEIGRAHV